MLPRGSASGGGPWPLAPDPWPLTPDPWPSPAPCTVPSCLWLLLYQRSRLTERGPGLVSCTVAAPPEEEGPRNRVQTRGVQGAGQEGLGKRNQQREPFRAGWTGSTALQRGSGSCVQHPVTPPWERVCAGTHAGPPSQLGWYSICLQRRRPGLDFWVGKIPWRRKWQPPPGFLPGDSHGQRGLAGCSPWDCKSRTLLSN